MTDKELKKYFEALSIKSRTYKVNEAYVKGNNPEILHQEQRKEPDNRLPIPFAKMAVEDMAGYAARPGDIKVRYESSEEANADEEQYNGIISDWMKDNEDDIEVSELYHKCLTHGSSYEIWWTEESDLENGVPIKPQWKRVDGDSIIIDYTEELKPRKRRALYFRQFPDRWICDVYYPMYSERWVRPKKNTQWFRDEEGDTTYPYTTVPVIEYTANMDRSPLFEAEKKIIEAQDKLLSNSQNEIDRYNALVALFPGKVDKELVDKLKEYKIIDELGEWEHWPEYLEKNLNGVTQFYNDLADRLERLFHKSIKVPDMSSESFGSADQSGVARAYKLLGMEFKASMIETYFNRGLKERKKFFDDIFENASTLNIGYEDFNTAIESKRNLPVDEKTKAEIAMQLKGIVSDETLLRFLPESIVRNVEKELELMEAEKASNPLLNVEDGEE